MNAKDISSRPSNAMRALPDGPGDRFSGYAIIGLPFQSGHVLALRRFPTSSIGPGYTAVWHRNPSGRWTFYSTCGAGGVVCAVFRWRGRTQRRDPHRHRVGGLHELQSSSAPPSDGTSRSRRHSRPGCSTPSRERSQSARGHARRPSPHGRRREGDAGHRPAESHRAHTERLPVHRRPPGGCG